ncbi:hypothetical protein [Limnohabitans sp.]|jgi:hypothetical protein|uniref:hypothetical protein n=1 Tax=Limnohabitans sp. TaxID=1907725 RepID=UPI001B403C00|nr:hypothetical protein [Limnohabitans sp.]MBP6244152.1 hypothetical protein [Limnohabitans sp.]
MEQPFKGQRPNGHAPQSVKKPFEKPSNVPPQRGRLIIFTGTIKATAVKAMKPR